MSLLLQFWEERIGDSLRTLLEDDVSEFAADYSGFVFVDGEEGDFGTIKYTDATGQLVVTRTVHGGDSEDVEFTDYGKTVMMGLVRQAFEKAMSEENPAVVEAERPR